MKAAGWQARRSGVFRQNAGKDMVTTAVPGQRCAASTRTPR